MARDPHKNAEWKEGPDRSIRPRLALLALGICPQEIKQAAGVSAVQVSNILSGRSRLTAERAKPVAQLIARRAIALLGERVQK